MKQAVRNQLGKHLASVGLTVIIALSAPLATPFGQADAQSLSEVSVADLSEKLLDSVVNISISENDARSADNEARPIPKVPEGQPFEDLFKDFFDGDESTQPRHISSLGSGFIIDPSGIIVTNNHVIDGADSIEVTLTDGTSLDAKLLGVDSKTDLAVLKVEPDEPLTAVKFGDSRKVRIGEWVLAIGNPFGLGGSVTLGIVSARGRTLDGPYDNFIQTDAAINKGNSGGPLFNMAGEVVGINTAILSPSGGSIGIGFSVPSELAENIIGQLVEYGHTRRGWLGIRVLEVSDALARSLGDDDPAGIAVGSIIEGGPMDGGPLQEGDIILRYGGDPVKTPRDLPRLVAESVIDEPVEVDIIRDGERMTVEVTPELLEEPDAAEVASDLGEDAPSMLVPGTPDDADVPVSLYGMTLSQLDDNGRAVYEIDGDVNGVLITDVDDDSPAAREGLQPGMVIAEIGQEAVETPQEAHSRLVGLTADGRRSVSMMVISPSGDIDIISLQLE